MNWETENTLPVHVKGELAECSDSSPLYTTKYRSPRRLSAGVISFPIEVRPTEAFLQKLNAQWEAASSECAPK